MSSKPSTRPDFNANLTNASLPVGSKISDGYPNAAPLPSSDVNWILGWNSRWIKWLDDGDLIVNGLVTPPTFVALPSGTTNDVDLTPLAGKLAVSLTGGGGNATITGIKSTSAEDGRLLQLTNETGSTVRLSIEDSGSSAANRIDAMNAGAGATLNIPPKGAVLLVYTDPPTGRWAVRATNFAVDFSTRSKLFGPYTWREIGGANHVQNTGFIALGASTDPLIFPLVVEPGITIVSFTIYVDKVSSASQTLTGSMFKFGMISGTPTQIGTNVSNSAANPGFILLTQSGLSEPVLDDTQYYLRLVPGSAISGDSVYGYRFGYVRGS